MNFNRVSTNCTAYPDITDTFANRAMQWVLIMFILDFAYQGPSGMLCGIVLEPTGEAKGQYRRIGVMAIGAAQDPLTKCA